MSFPPEFIHRAVVNQAFQISIHTDDERLADGLKIDELESALTNCEIIGQYPEDARGESCLALGFLGEKPKPFVGGRNRTGHPVLITVYIPSMPKWKDPYTRNR
jgi:hypothetical protein